MAQAISQPSTKVKKSTNGHYKKNGHTNGNGNPTAALNAFGFAAKNPTQIRIMPEEMERGTVLDGVSQKVFLDRYSLKDELGNALEQHPEQMWRRIARAISQIEKPEKQKEWEEKFYSAMEGFKFVPGGRILSGAGTGFDVTYYNCYVLPSPKDSRRGIMSNITDMVDIMARGGGVGVNLSSLRPRGSRVKKVNGFSSGPLTWAELYSVATHDVIQQGGTRRGALMLMLWDWHPDIEEFITVKKDLSRIRGANLSICISDRLMEAVKKDEDWPLLFPDTDDPDYDLLWDGILDNWIKAGKAVKILKTIKARELWDMICEAAWQSAEPGLHFMERTNKLSSNSYFNYLNCTNPCVTSDVLVTTSAGLERMGDLYKKGKPFVAVVGGRRYLSTAPFKTGTKKVFKLKTKEGYELRLTQDHKVYTPSGKVPAGYLKAGDKLNLNTYGAFGTLGSLEEGRVWGWLVGDGSVKKDRAELFFYGQEKQELAPLFAQTVGLMVEPETSSNRSYSVSAIYVDSEDKAVVKSARLLKVAQRLGFAHGHKLIVPESVLTGSESLQRGFLQGIFSSDGHVAGTPEKGVSVRLTSVSISLLVDVQRLLLNLGVYSRIYKNRRLAGVKLLPNGRGGSKEYNTQAQHDLVISKTEVAKFAALVGFLQEEKQEKLRSLMALYTRGPYKQEFLATFSSLEEDGFEDVYDITVADVHRFSANGLVVSNCGEEPLPAYGVCNLGSLNLANFVNEEGELDYESLNAHARVATRFLDNVVDGDIYIFDGIRKTQLEGERRIGLGTMGLGDALIKMKIRYGSDESLPVIEKIYKVIRDAAFDESSNLAREKGAFPKFDRTKYPQGPFIKSLPEDIRAKVKKYGVRNSVVLMQAPTGSTSLMAGVTSGIEPVYEFVFIRRDRIGEHKIFHPLLDTWRKDHPADSIPDYFVSSSDLRPEDHIKVQAAVQKYVDASISKTVNAPNSYTVDDVKKLYMMAYDFGLKGVTFFRDGSRPGVLSKEESPVPAATQDQGKPAEVIEAPQTQAIPGQTLLPRPEAAEGITYRVATPMGSAFITINKDELGNPMEVFVNIGRAGSDVAAMAHAIGRLLSIMLRMQPNATAADKVAEVIDKLAGVGGRQSVGFGPNRVRSLPDAIALTFAKHFHLNSKSLNGDSATNGEAAGHDQNLQAGAVMAAHNPDPTPAPAETFSETPKAHADICPACGVAAFVGEEGCHKCYACGHSEC